jgi:hypothetical protein
MFLLLNLFGQVPALLFLFPNKQTPSSGLALTLKENLFWHAYSSNLSNTFSLDKQCNRNNQESAAILYLTKILK